MGKFQWTGLLEGHALADSVGCPGPTCHRIGISQVCNHRRVWSTVDSGLTGLSSQACLGLNGSFPKVSNVGNDREGSLQGWYQSPRFSRVLGYCCVKQRSSGVDVKSCYSQ
ncbi:Uncharacterized protein TCM_003153 [Theobroma cacao]|uniref:Uncharacterized protein n=1 Tax=Theobroma cacao TaxID=3641 RepID=A0A061DMM3_THECC|nr:Uncharacterized protein TCM_003153 [Theobroma cacao]